jgi:hypothetical protein
VNDELAGRVPNAGFCAEPKREPLIFILLSFFFQANAAQQPEVNRSGNKIGSCVRRSLVPDLISNQAGKAVGNIFIQ